MTLLQKYSFPRNVREIEDMIENWVVNGKHMIKKNDLPFYSLPKGQIEKFMKITPQIIEYVSSHGMKALLNEIQKDIFDHYRKQGESARETSRILGISHTTVSRTLKGEKTDVGVLSLA